MSKNFIIREAVLSDTQDIYHINKTSLGYDYDFDKQKSKIEVVLNDKTQVIYVAECDNKVVGYIHLVNYDVIYADNFKNCLGLAVDIEYKRNGIGSALLNQAEIWAKENGAVGIRLCSGVEREKAHQFYQSQGYEVTKLQKNIKKIF
ncbi:MAG: GNAT family N-acetyltransferase [Clostridia bacterium]|nr:GNAT family N-acetyltransferase [Clostridia bacterium]